MDLINSKRGVNMSKKLSELEVSELKEIALNIRCKAVEMARCAGTAHLGPTLSLVEILTTLYFKVMDIDPDNPCWEDRDRLILSKGHGCISLYVILAELGFFDKEKLNTFCGKLDTDFGGHPERKLPGIEANTGSLGHGFPIGVGMAKAAKIDKKDYQVYTILGDGENQEGTIWEGAMAAKHFNLDNLVAIVDRNHLQVSGYTDDIMNISPLADKWKSFGWGVKVVDGHDINELYDTFNSAPFKKDCPSVIIAKTVKGKGLSFAENKVEWHHKVPDDEQYEQAKVELSKGGSADES